MPKLQILSAKAGVFKARKFKPAKRNSRRNGAPQGFYDKKGEFHSLAAPSPKKRKPPKKKRTNAKKRVPKKKTNRKKPTAKKAARAKRRNK